MSIQSSGILWFSDDPSGNPPFEESEVEITVSGVLVELSNRVLSDELAMVNCKDGEYKQVLAYLLTVCRACCFY